jgi:hypothetical protein
MEETIELKRQGYIGYRLHNGLYQLVDFATNEVLDIMPNVAILFDGDTLLKHGHPIKIQAHFDKLKAAYQIMFMDHDLNIISGRIPIDELDKVLTITGYQLYKRLSI